MTPAPDRPTSKFRVYSPDHRGYSEARSIVAEISPNQWLALEIEVPAPSGPLRLDPTNRRSLVEFSEIEIRQPVNNDLIWRLEPTRLGELVCGGDAVQVPGESLLTVLSLGVDPQLYLPHLEVPDRTAMLRIRCRLRIDPDFHSSPEVLEKCSTAILQLRKSIEYLGRQYEERRTSYLRQHSQLQSQLSQTAAKKQTLEAENTRLERLLIQSTSNLQEQCYWQNALSRQWVAKQQRLEDENGRLQKLLTGLTSDLAMQVGRHDAESLQRATLQIRLQAEGSRAEELSRNLNAIRSSLSWRITSPLRAVASLALKVHELLLRGLYQSGAFAITGKIIAKAVSSGSLPLGRFFLPSNPLFSAEFYASSNPDVSRTRNLWAHYIGFGADEGRNPHPLFNTRYYVINNPDVAARGLNPLIHYYVFGAAEKRQPHPEFDLAEHLRHRQDKIEGQRD